MCKKTLRSLMQAKQFLARPLALGRKAGMTLIEIIIVVALIGTLMGIIVNSLTSTSDNAMRDECKIQMAVIQQSLSMYRVHNVKFPTTAQGLKALAQDPGDAKSWRGPYIEEKKLKDPWGHDFDYESDGQKFKIVSKGSNDADPSDDIFYPEEAGASSEKKPE